MGHTVIDLGSLGEHDGVEDDDFEAGFLTPQPGLRVGAADVNGKRALKNAMLLIELGLVRIGRRREREELSNVKSARRLRSA
jgi:hypothetical protein